MLTQLCIRNILLLKECDIPFAAGLNVLTGETGAGKSILLDALGLALGERSDAGLVRSGEPQASVAAEFFVAADAAVNLVLRELDLPISDVLILRRSLQADGKSRAFVNDAPVSVTALKRIGETLVARHGQHDQRGLLDSKTHRALLDMAAGNEKMLQQCGAAFSAWKAALRARDELAAMREQAARDEAWLRQTIAELGALQPRVGEEGELLDIRRAANQTKESIKHLQSALEQLNANDGVTLALRQSAKSLLKANWPNDDLNVIVSGLERAENEAEEAIVALQQLLRGREVDPHVLEEAEDRLHALRDAARKFNTTVEALADRYDDACKKIATLEHNADAERQNNALLQQTVADYEAAANALFAAREAAAKKLIKQVELELKPLKMASTKLRVTQQRLPEAQWGEAGMHQVMFEVATNEGLPFGPLAKVASGGELSRLLLAMKLVLRSDETNSQIFDEIDSGTGGAVAEAIGVRLKTLASDAQVLVVTHLPQVAAQASHHLFISKSGGKQVRTDVKLLDKTARAEELARMLSGETISDEARKAAKKLLQAAV
jgi:DNA repair protein RecN (Recombination protein N)